MHTSCQISCQACRQSATRFCVWRLRREKNSNDAQKQNSRLTRVVSDWLESAGLLPQKPLFFKGKSSVSPFW
jgi:hypothetical protein